MTAVPASRAAELLGPEGPLARHLGGYEARAGQLLMADAVEGALRDEHALFCEAGTGTGKTLAYLVPAILSGKKVVVSTATRALQEQIFAKDLPLIARGLGLHPQAALMKGLSNYACLRRYHAFRTSADALRPSVASSLGVIERWIEETETGDLSELAGLSEGDPILAAVGSSSDTRIGPACAHYDECFVTRMKRDAEQAQLVVVNHHLFFADLALRGPHPGRVLPDYDAVIFDEAHQLEDIATVFFSTRVTQNRIELLLRDLDRALSPAGAAGPLFGRGGPTSLVQSTRSASAEFWKLVASAARAQAEGRVRVDRDFWVGPAIDAYHRLDSTLEALGSFAETERDKVDPRADRRAALAAMEALDVTLRRTTALRNDLAAVVEGGVGRITWAEAAEQKVALSSSPIDVSDVFKSRVFDSIPSVILTSATLASGSGDRSFRFVRSRLGVGDAGVVTVNELMVPSPFDYEENALLYLPDDLPDPADAAFPEAAVQRTAELIAASQGGAFVLTTSLRAMRRLHAGLRDACPGRRVLVQGAAPKAALVSSFRADGDAVLVATMSFWQGVDVPGRSLRLVVIDKIPFPVPTDPVMLARAEALSASGGNAFVDLHVPTAKIALKQGFGRLIRTRSDYGVVALLDGRVLRRGYGRSLLSGLPPARRTQNIDDVHTFFDRRNEAAKPK